MIQNHHHHHHRHHFRIDVIRRFRVKVGGRSRPSPPCESRSFQSPSARLLAPGGRNGKPSKYLVSLPFSLGRPRREESHGETFPKNSLTEGERDRGEGRDSEKRAELEGRVEIDLPTEIIRVVIFLENVLPPGSLFSSGNSSSPLPEMKGKEKNLCSSATLFYLPSPSYVTCKLFSARVGWRSHDTPVDGYPRGDRKVEILVVN